MSSQVIAPSPRTLIERGGADHCRRALPILHRQYPQPKHTGGLTSGYPIRGIEEIGLLNAVDRGPFESAQVTFTEVIAAVAPALVRTTTWTTHRRPRKAAPGVEPHGLRRRLLTSRQPEKRS